MSCNSCGSVSSNCSCSDNCPNKASDITVFDCNTFNVIEIPCEASLCDVLGLLESYTTNMVNELSEMTSVVIGAGSCIDLPAGTYSIQQVMDALNDFICNIPEITIEAGDGIDVNLETIGNQKTYTISTLGAMLSQSIPINISNIEPTVSVGLYANGITQVMGEVYDDDAAYNPLTGIWTCPSTGRYNVNFYVHLTNESTGFSDGMIIAGITSATSNIFYTVSSVTFNQVTRHADITGTSLGVVINAGTQLVLKVLNLSDINYVSNSGDVVKMSIQKVK